MKYSTILGLTAAVTLAAASPVKRQSSFAKVDGLKFNIDGVTKYYAGTNAYWLGFTTGDADIDTALDRLKESGIKLLRIWGFNDVNTVPTDGTVWYQSFVAGQDPVINTGANGLQRLDYVVKSAESRGIKLIINFVNNWTDYGGMAAYMKRFGGSANPDWYANADIQAQYKKYIKAVVSRYIDSPAIFAWELANEPRCNGCDTSVIYDWAKETSAYIKSLDANHLVTLGDEGFGVAGGDGSYPYQKSEGVDFSKNLEIDTLDYGTFHLYPDSWGQPNEPFGSEWVTAHGAACATAGKPCIFEEYGVKTDKCNIEGKWQLTALNTTGIAADQFWDFGTTLSWGQTNNDGNTIFTGTSDWECLVTKHVANIG